MMEGTSGSSRSCEKRTNNTQEETSTRENLLANVATNFDAKVATDSSGGAFQRIGGTEHLSASGHGFLSFPDHGNNRSRQHVFLQFRKEWFVYQVFVVFFQQFAGGLLGFHRDQFVSLGFESRNNVTNNSSLNSIRLDLQLW